jgi:diguanylate cyclase (GGDEF)-like protein
MTDALTGLPNRAAFDDFLFRHVHARIENEVPRALGLLMLDVDRFKRFNDTYGHAVGDEVLRMVGGVLLRLTRKSDLSARYGGEEFAVVVPNATPFGLRSLAERLRRGVAEEVLAHEDRQLSVSVSIGGAWLGRATSQRDARALIEAADRYLYRAKEAGRNRCELPATDPPLG